MHVCSTMCVGGEATRHEWEGPSSGSLRHVDMLPAHGANTVVAMWWEGGAYAPDA